MPEITLHFPDDGARDQFARWWALRGKESCLLFMSRTIPIDPLHYLHVQEAEDDPTRWEFWWDDIPF